MGREVKGVGAIKGWGGKVKVGGDKGVREGR